MRDFQAYAPAGWRRCATPCGIGMRREFREAAHKLCGLLSAFSTAAGDVASDLEEHAARGQLDEAKPLVVQLEVMVQELIREMNYHLERAVNPARDRE